MRYLVWILLLPLMGTGCVERLVTEQVGDVLLDSGLDGMELLMDEVPVALDDSMTDIFVDSIAQTNGVWSYAGNTLSSEKISFTTFFDTYVNLSATDDASVVRVQNYDPLLDALIDGGFFAWVDLDAPERGDNFSAYFTSFEDVQLGGRTWVTGSHTLEVGDAPAQGYRYEDGSNHFEILVYANDEQGLERAGDFVQTLELKD